MTRTQGARDKKQRKRKSLPESYKTSRKIAKLQKGNRLISSIFKKDEATNVDANEAEHESYEDGNSVAEEESEDVEHSKVADRSDVLAEEDDMLAEDSGVMGEVQHTVTAPSEHETDTILDESPVLATFEEEEGAHEYVEIEVTADEINGSKKKRPDPTSVQQVFLKAVQERLNDELKIRDRKAKDRWLLRYLQNNDWWIRQHHAVGIAKKLKIKTHYFAYYRDIDVWIPDARWGSEAMPACPNCLTNSNVSPFGFRLDDHYGRLVFRMKDTYYLLSRRYKCHECERIRSIQQSLQGDEHANDKEKRTYTFMGYNMKSTPLLPYSYGDHLNAFLTRKAGVHMEVIDFMRPLFDSGVKRETFSKLMVELHSKEHTRCHIQYVETIRRNKANPSVQQQTFGPFSTFDDKEKYCGSVPTGKYLADVYKGYHESISHHLLREVKKRGAKWLHCDASYKEAKNLCRHDGEPIFKALMTVNNEVGEIRIQNHLISDSHSQMIPAYESFKHTQDELGYPGPEMIFTDDPAKDKKFLTRIFPSVRNKQREFDDHCGIIENSNLPEFDEYSNLIARSVAEEKDVSQVIRVVLKKNEINEKIAAIREELRSPGAKNEVSIDCEWEVDLHSGRQSKVCYIAIAYRDCDGALRVLLVRTSKLDKLPHRLIALLEDHQTLFVGVSCRNDLRKIGRDFKLDSVVDRRLKAGAVVDLGVFARERGVVPDARVGVKELCRLVLAKEIDKDDDQTFSDWSRSKLTEEQMKYLVNDVAAHQIIYEGLQLKPNLERRLNVTDVVVGKRIDVVPRNSHVACMATRAAAGIILESTSCKSPAGIIPQMRKPAKNEVVVQIDTMYSGGLLIPGYSVGPNKSAALSDFDTGSCLVLPVRMLKEHIESDEVQPYPEERLEEPIAEVEEYTEEDDDEYNDDCQIDEIEECDFDLTSDDIARLASVTREVEETTAGSRVPLRCDNLSTPPAPEEIQDCYSAVLGDCFHAMDRPKVPMQHEAKKAYKVALRNAFFVREQQKMSELETKMLNRGKSQNEIDQMKYFNPRVFNECVERTVLPPRLLYWRVRAVFAFFGRLVDSKTKRSLFNSTAWKKADNILLEILLGFYSDPPGESMYVTRFNSDGTVMRNRYGIVMIECRRGTNRTEAIHKYLVATFGGSHVGVEMASYLLAERRHRHNQRCSELRRFGYPKVGHYDSWLIDKLQNLVLDVTGATLYQYWSNASDYRDTPEKLGTVPLQSSELKDALTEQWENRVVRSKVKLTRDQKFLCREMGTQLPFLPFSGKDEYKAYTRFVQDYSPSTDEEAAKLWCLVVDGVTTFPKLPAYMKSQREIYEKKQRITDSNAKSSSGVQLLDELNNALTHIEDAVVTSNPDPMPEIPQQAHNDKEFVLAGGTAIGNVPVSEPQKGVRGCDKGKRKKRVCGRCEEFGGVNSLTMHMCAGKGGKLGRKSCQYYDEFGAWINNV